MSTPSSEESGVTLSTEESTEEEGTDGVCTVGESVPTAVRDVVTMASAGPMLTKVVGVRRARGSRGGKAKVAVWTRKTFS